MVKLFKRVGMKLKNLSPAAIREIIVIAVILCVSVILSIPEYREDVEREKAWREMRERIEQSSEKGVK
jgi:hypothetical protein